MSMGIASAFADVTITVSRDDTFTDNGDDTASTGGGRTFTYYKVFSASYGDAFTGNSQQDGGYDADGNPVAPAGDTTNPVSYTASAAVAAKLGTWDATAKTWTKATGNLWFKLTPIAGSDNYTVEWDNTSTDAATAQAAAAWLKTNSVYESTGTGTLTWDATAKAWSATVSEGYYILESDTGDNLIAATTNVDVKEKNDYPPQDKTQADEDDTTQSDTDRDVAIGDVLTYEVKVTIPKTAAVGNTIQVYDIPSKGLTYNNDVKVKDGSNTGEATIADGTLGTGEAWHKVITVTDGSQGTDVVFTFTMTVNADALTDGDRVNTSKIEYGNNYKSLPDEVKFKTYFTGIEKVDGTTQDPLEGVKFTLTEDGQPFYVVKSGDYYIPDTSDSTTKSNEVVTDADGKIVIRGLDDDKTYVLHETETLDGYNLLAEDKTLTLVEDKDVTSTTTDPDTNEETSSTAAAYTTATFDKVENNKGTVLPSTGGIGTTIFYVVGSIMVVAAGVLLITKKRMSREG
ncbi:MAG: isopeptide-forming domain-containing fimbrial protein [Oscillospiraceae bacterium]|nr:isopeptide-forming domain-containing fimbrial protein [Oscillospiraceae bacterium]